MPNWVTNRIRIEGKDAKAVLFAHLAKDENGQEAFDFNTIERMPEELKVEKSSRSLDGLLLYIAKINPLIDVIGDKRDKVVPVKKFIGLLEKAFNTNDYERIGVCVIKPKQIEELKEKYNGKFYATIDWGRRSSTTCASSACLIGTNGPSETGALNGIHAIPSYPKTESRFTSTRLGPLQFPQSRKWPECIQM